MRSGVNDDMVLAEVLRQDHAIVVVVASAIALLGWAYLFYQGWATQHMDLVAMAMPSTGAWGPVDLLLNLAWIAALSVFVLLEKIIPRGFWMAKAAGLFLMGWGGWMALSSGA
jgi:predicted metal-binding membrane protein